MQESQYRKKTGAGDSKQSGLRIDPYFSKPGTHPFDELDWVKHHVETRDRSGNALFVMEDVEAPSKWSPRAVQIAAEKYFRKAGIPNERGHESSIKELVSRVADAIADWGQRHGYFATEEDTETFRMELTWLLVNQYAAFNSPVWFNCGLHHKYGVEGGRGNWAWNMIDGDVHQVENNYSRPQCSACFILSVEDSLIDKGGIMDFIRSEARIFKYGSGSGANFSRIRGEGEKLSGGGSSSGLMSFLKIPDVAAGSIKSGGTTRRAAKMVIVDDDHPEILQFIDWKAREEDKAHMLLENGIGLDATGTPDFNGEAYQTVSGQNSNNSVRLSDAFMQTYLEGGTWDLTARTTGETMKTIDSREMMKRVSQAAWRCADPGVQFHDTINDWHTCPNTGPIRGSNPCVTGDTMVATTEGHRRIDSLVGEEPVIIGGDGKPRVAIRVFKTGTKPIYELTTRSGYSLRLTEDHRVLTRERGDVAAAELTPDDTILLQGAGFGRHHLGKEVAELLGTAIGDGCVSGGQKHLFVTLAKQESDVATELRGFMEIAKKSLAYDGRGQRPTQVVQTPTTLRVGTSSQGVVELLQEYAVLDEGSQNKRLKDIAFLLDRESQAMLLRGLFTADGTVADYGEKSQYISLDSSSLDLLKQVQLMLLSFGIKSKLYKQRRSSDKADLPDGKGGMKQYPVVPMHSLRITRSSRVVFEKEIGFNPSSPKAIRLHEMNERVGTYKDELVDKVATLEHVGTEDVYDLTEPVTSHFVANGITVHNCSEYMFLDNTACNLASLNLMKFLKDDATFDVEGYHNANRIVFIAQEILVDLSSYPTEEIARNSHDFRPLGLGYANLGTLLMCLGVPYDSPQARAIAGAVTSIMNGVGYLTSAEMAAVQGPFAGYKDNEEPMLRVMRKHREHAVHMLEHGTPITGDDQDRHTMDPRTEGLARYSVTVWDQVLDAGKEFGFRNSQATVLAPTGTIGFLMDCDTTGIEPDFALAKWKLHAGGEWRQIVNRSIPLALERLGYTQEEIQDIIDYVNGDGSTPGKETIEGAPHVKPEHYPVFDCANKCGETGTRFIHHMGHVRMMAAAQPFISGAISKTINMPEEVTAEDIEEVYSTSWRLGIKAMAIYRDGSKHSQPLSTKATKKKAEQTEEEDEALEETPRIRWGQLKDLKDTTSQVWKTRVRVMDPELGTMKVHITFREDDDGNLAEIFISAGNKGSTTQFLCDSLAKAWSRQLRLGFPVNELAADLVGQNGPIRGMTGHPLLKTVKGIEDLVGKLIAYHYLGETRFINKELLQQYQQSLEYEPPRHEFLAELKAFRRARLERPEKRLDDFSENGHTAEPEPTPTVTPSVAVDGAGGLPETEAREEKTCHSCGFMMVRNGACYKCINCGETDGCS
jgi:ribonucleoside-diphosphate reductase alpha chain